MSRSKIKRKIAIGTITRDRPLMLANLLRSYARMKLPANAEVCFIIVENSATASLDSIIDTFAKSVPYASVIYQNEPIQGIASARNRVLNFAIEQEFDLLSFADDDEEVDDDWLIELIKEMDENGLDLVGSPVRIAPLTTPASRWHKMVWSAVNEANQNAEQRALQLRMQGKADTIRIATGSWLANLEFFDRTGLRFNDGLGLSGGEDWELYAEAKKLGARTSWTPYAIAWETLPITRLSLGYFYRRSRDHARTTTHQQFSKSFLKSCIRMFGSIIARLFKVLRALIISPFEPARSALTIVACFGAVVGMIDGAQGKRSYHYKTVEGY